MHKTIHVVGYAGIALVAGALIAAYQLELMPGARTTLRTLRPRQTTQHRYSTSAIGCARVIGAR